MYNTFKINGYKAFYDPEHPLSNKAGIVYLHRHIMSIYLGRWISTEEVVHHKDYDRANNSLENLVVMSNSDHTSLHTRSLSRNDFVCPYCGKKFTSTKTDRKYCSNECRNLAERKFTVSKEVLQKLVWEIPTAKIAEMFGVSDKTIEKRCKKFGVEKPSRGFWSKRK